MTITRSKTRKSKGISWKRNERISKRRNRRRKIDQEQEQQQKKD